MAAGGGRTAARALAGAGPGDRQPSFFDSMKRFVDRGHTPVMGAHGTVMTLSGPEGMKSWSRRTDIPLLLLYNVDPCWEPADAAMVLDGVSKLHVALQQEGHPVIDVPVHSADFAGVLERFHPDQHVVFNWCDELPGLPRGDALVAEVLECSNFAYTGSPAAILEVSWNKSHIKRLLSKNRIPTPRWQVYSSAVRDGWRLFPAIVKPAFDHCSTGITTDAVVLDSAELKERVAFVRNVLHQPALVEDFIDGREFHVTLLGNGEIKMLPPAEMDFSAFDDVRDRLCTFDSKFTPGSVHYEHIDMRVPALLDKRQYSSLKQTALRAYRVVGCRDYARIDLRLRNGTFYVLDINPNPDFSTDTSLVYAAEAAGLSYGAIGSQVANFAAERHPLFGAGRVSAA
jgi:D-alanine-D-alanine ligase